jgi:hypothetical protein
VDQAAVRWYGETWALSHYRPPTTREGEVMNANEFIRNCNTHTLEELAPYVRQYVAWSEDGKAILASAPDMNELFKKVDKEGITRYVIDFIFPPDEVFLGGAGL